MGNGYLGKISAIVTANTGDFKPKLDAAASDVQRFARTVQSNLTSASSSASKAFDGIWTKLQRMENSLQAAGGMKLSFKGFDGAIKTVDQLNARLAELARRQINVSVSGTGFQTLNQMREALASIKQADVDFIRKNGGLAYVRENREYFSGKENARIDKFAGLSSLDQIDKAVEVLSGGFFDDAARKMRMVVSAAKEVAEPVAAAVQKFEALSLELQGQFAPAMNNASKKAESLRSAIESSPESVTNSWIGQIANMAERTTAALNRLAEAEASVKSLSSGSELRFRNPGLADALGTAKQNDAAFGRMSSSRASQLGVGDRAFATRRAAEEAIRASAATESARLTGDVVQIARAVELEQTRLAALQRENEINAQLLAQEQARTNEAAEATAEARRRAEVASALLNVLQEESTLISNEGVAQDITAYLQQLEEARARTEQLEEATRRARVASALLNVLQEESTLISNEGRSTPFEPGYFGDRLARDARARMGGDIPGGSGPSGGRLEVGRQVDNAVDRVGALRRQIDALPDGLRAAFIPSLERATNAAQTLARAGAGATADQLRRAAREAESLEHNLSRTSRARSFGEQFGGPGRRGVEFSLQDQSLRGYTAQLQILQQTLAGVSTEARSSATGPFNRLRTAIAEAAARGTIGLRGTREEIQRLTQDAVRAAAASAGLSARTLGRTVSRAGDIGRAGFGNAGLAIQQAIFAFDDFNSVTGGLDQRIRAMGNNLSQFGFIVGGTAGLMAGVLTSAIAQVVVGYIKWQNAGVGTEEQIKSLNDALARQKSLAEDLAEAFRAVADEIGRIGFSKRGADAAQFERQIVDIKKKQREFNTEQSAALDPQVQQQRGIIAARQRQLEASSNAGERVRLNREINEAREAERRRLRELENRPSVSPGEAIERAAEIRVRGDREERRRRAIAGGFTYTVREQAAFDREDRQRLEGARGEAANAGRLPRAAGIRAAIASIDEEQTRLEGMVRANPWSNNSGRNARIAELQELRLRLQQGAVAAANALEVEVTKSAIAAAKRIESAQEKVAAAIESGVPGSVGLQVELDALTEKLRDAETKMSEAQSRAREYGTGGDLAAAEDAKNEVERIKLSIDAREREAKAVDAARASIEMFARAMERISSEAASSVEDARKKSEQASTAARFRPTANRQREAAVAEADFRERQRERDELDREIAQAEERRRNDPEARKQREGINEIDAMLGSTGVLAPGQRETLINERQRLMELEGESNRDALVDQKKREMDDIIARQEASARGRDLRMRPGEKAGLELGNNLSDLEQAFIDDIAEGLKPDKGRFEADRARIINDAMRQTAPDIFRMADEVENAIVQGPSRAALQATDVSTSQGAAELNRLLRGDDSAKDQNLVELQKQSKSLDDLVTIARENAGVGVWN